MAKPDRKRTLRDLLRVVFRRWLLFLMGSLLFATAALGLAENVPVKYTGMAIFERRSDVAAEELSRDWTDASGSLKLTLEHELAGYKAVESAVEELGLTRGMARGPDGHYTDTSQMQKQTLIEKLRKDINVTWQVRSDQVDLVDASFTHSDPKLARDMPNTLVTKYIDRVSRLITDRLTGSKNFLLRQVNQAESTLEQHRRNKLKFEREHAGIVPQSPGLLQQRIEQIGSSIGALRRQQILAKQKVARLTAALGPYTGTTTRPLQLVKGPNPELRRLETELRGARDQLEDAIAIRGMKDKHPTVVALRKKIQRLERRIEMAPREIVLHKVFGTDRLHGDLVLQLAGARAEVDITTSEIKRLSEQQASYQKLVNNYTQNRESYLKLLYKEEQLEGEVQRWRERYEKVDMALQAEAAKYATHLEAVQLAPKLYRPSFPKLWMVLAFAVAGGLAFGWGLVVVANLLDRSIKTREDAVEYFDTPVHGVIGEIVTRGQRRLRRLRRWVLGPVVAVVVLVALSATALNAVLWLEFPEPYKQWRQSPTRFIRQHATDLAGKITRNR